MDWQLAQWIGVPVWVFDDVPVRTLEEARIVMAATNQAQEAAHRKVSKR
jgi:hypothetical protein